MNLTEEKKTPLRQKKLDEKREMLAMRFKGSIQVDQCCYMCLVDADPPVVQCTSL